MLREALDWHRYHARKAQYCRMRANNCSDVIRQNEWDVDADDHYMTAKLFLGTVRALIEAEAQAYTQACDRRRAMQALRSVGEDRPGNIELLHERRHSVGASEVRT